MDGQRTESFSVYRSDDGRTVSLSGKNVSYGYSWISAIYGDDPGGEKEDELVLRLKNTPETELRYPFLFELDICWKLIEDTLQITYQVRNKDTKTMHFGIGGHPGFCVPIADGLAFEEYCIDFGENAQLSQVVLSDDCFVTENTVPGAPC